MFMKQELKHKQEKWKAAAAVTVRCRIQPTTERHCWKCVQRKKALYTVTEPTTMWKSANPKDRRHLVQQEEERGRTPAGEETRYVQAVQMGNPWIGAWTKWDTEQREFTWDKLWKYKSY
jgi:hypothetical protein